MDFHFFHSFLCFFSLSFEPLFAGFQFLSKRSYVALELSDLDLILSDVFVEFIAVGGGLGASSNEFAAAVVGIALYHFVHVGFIYEF